MLIDKDGNEVQRSKVAEGLADLVTGVLGACIGVSPEKGSHQREIRDKVMDGLDAQGIKYTSRDVNKIVKILLRRN